MQLMQLMQLLHVRIVQDCMDQGEEESIFLVGNNQ
jgi:hypothetical protein